MENIFTFVKSKLKESNLAKLREVAEKTGVPYNTLVRIKYQNVNPRVETIQPIFNFFSKKK